MKLQRDVFGHSELAHDDARGTLKARQYTQGTPMQISASVADLRLDAGKDRLDRQVLFGHPVRQLAPNGPARDETSGYVGYIAADDLAPHTPSTHRIWARHSLLFDAPDIKSPNPQPLSMNSLLSIVAEEGRFARTYDGRFAILSHLRGVDHAERDFASHAERLLGAPYLWGGNAAFGIDCSGLVQISLQMAHLPCPGDSDQQMEMLGTDVTGQTPQRNDLFFWPGHVAIAVSDTHLIHANAHHMAVAYEKITEACARIEQAGDGKLLMQKRL